MHKLDHEDFSGVSMNSIAIFFSFLTWSRRAAALSNSNSRAASIGKVIGSGYGAILGGLTRREAVQLGTGMVSRGEVGLIVATIGIEQGLIHEDIYSAVLGVVIFTTLLTPPMLRALFPKKQQTIPKVNATSQGDAS